MHQLAYFLMITFQHNNLRLKMENKYFSIAGDIKILQSRTKFDCWKIKVFFPLFLSQSMSIFLFRTALKFIFHNWDFGVKVNVHY